MVGIFFRPIIFLAGFLILVLAVLVATAVFASGIYQLGWDGKAVRAFAKAVPLPAAVADGEVISVNEVYNFEDFYRRLGKDFTKSQILETLIADRLIAKWAVEHDVFVISEEIAGHEEFLRKKFPDLAGENEFREKFVTSDLIRRKSAIAWLADKTLDEDFVLLQKVQRELMQGSLSFVDAAVLYSDDEESKYIGGDLGFLSKSDLPAWFADMIYDLPLEKLSRIAASPDGYHIFEVVSEDDESNPPRRQVRQIFVSGPSFEEYLKELRRSTRVLVFGKM